MSSVSSLFREATAQYNAGLLDEADATLVRALTAKPTHVKSLILKGVIHNARQRYDKAIEKFDAALRVQANNGLAFGNRGIARRNKGQTREAIADFTRALALLGADVSFLKQRAIAYRVLEQYDLALDDYNQAIALSPSNSAGAESLAELLYQRSRVYMRLGEHESRLADLADALRLEPNNKTYRTAFVEASAALDDDTSAAAAAAAPLAFSTAPSLVAVGQPLVAAPTPGARDSSLRRATTANQILDKKSSLKKPLPATAQHAPMPTYSTGRPIIYAPRVELSASPRPSSDSVDNDDSESSSADEPRHAHQHHTSRLAAAVGLRPEQLHTSTHDSDDDSGAAAAAPLPPHSRVSTASPYAASAQAAAAALSPRQHNASPSASTEYPSMSALPPLPSVPSVVSPQLTPRSDESPAYAYMPSTGSGTGTFEFPSQIKPAAAPSKLVDVTPNLDQEYDALPRGGLVQVNTDSAAAATDDYFKLVATPSTRNKVASQSTLVAVKPVQPITDDEYAVLVRK